jgi:hypothetical protein
MRTLEELNEQRSWALLQGKRLLISLAEAVELGVITVIDQWDYVQPARDFPRCQQTVLESSNENTQGLRLCFSNRVKMLQVKKWRKQCPLEKYHLVYWNRALAREYEIEFSLSSTTRAQRIQRLILEQAQDRRRNTEADEVDYENTFGDS